MSQYFGDLVSTTAAQVQKAACHTFSMLEIIITPAPLEVLIAAILFAWPTAALGHPSLGAGSRYRVSHGCGREGVHEGRLLVEFLEYVTLATCLDRAVPAIVAELILTVTGRQSSCLRQCAGQAGLLATLMILSSCSGHISARSTHLALRCKNGHDSVLRNEVFAVERRILCNAIKLIFKVCVYGKA